MDDVCCECYQIIDSCTCTYYDLNEEFYIQPKYKKGISCILINVDELNKLKQENEQLLEENKNLREENEKLRRQARKCNCWDDLP